MDPALQTKLIAVGRTLLSELDLDTLVVSAIAGEVDRSALGVELALEGSAGGHVLQSRRPERLAELRRRLHFALGDHVAAEAGLFVPMLFRGGAVGVLEAFDRLESGPEFTADDEQLLVAFAASAATAVATAQSAQAEGLQRSLQASERERKHWARELHDETLQALGGLRLLLSTARRQEDPAVLARAVDDAVARLTTDIGNLRALITDLRPASLDELGARPRWRPWSGARASSPASRSACTSTSATTSATATSPSSRTRSTASSRRRCPTP